MVVLSVNPDNIPGVAVLDPFFRIVSADGDDAPDTKGIAEHFYRFGDSFTDAYAEMCIRDRNRHFLAESWEHLIPKECWEDAREEARERVNLDIETDIQGFDIDAAAIKAARANAKMAGVDKLIHFQQRPVSELRHSKPFGFIVTNPPYGERIEEKENLPALYREIGESYKRLDRWSMYLIDVYKRQGRKCGTEALPASGSLHIQDRRRKQKLQCT